jgi:hypothetical protein
MSDNIHPNVMGHFQLHEAFENVAGLQPQPLGNFPAPLCVGISNCASPFAVLGAEASMTTTSTGAQVRLGNNGSTPSLILDTGTHTTILDSFGGFRFVFDNASVLMSSDTSGNVSMGGNLTVSGSGLSTVTGRLQIGSVAKAVPLILTGGGINGTALGTANLTFGLNGSTPTISWDDTTSTGQIDYSEAGIAAATPGWRFLQNESTTSATLTAAGALTLTKTVQTGVSTVSGLSTCNTAAKGTRSFVTDANATTFHTTAAGGGSNNMAVVCDGTNWYLD